MITIVGVGALGSHVALFLRNTEHPIKLVDFDRVLMKNTHAQFHTRIGQGKNKVQALGMTMLALFGRKVELVPHKLGKHNVAAILNPECTDLVLDCTDNIAARRTIMDFCTDQHIPCVHGCLSADGTFARVVWNEVFQPDAEGDETATCEDGEHLPFFAYVAAVIALEVQRYLDTGKKRSVHVGVGNLMVI